MGRAKIREVPARGIAFVSIPVSLLVLAACWMSYGFLPMPPETLVMTTGMEGGTFSVIGERYRQVLAREGIQVRLLPSSGSVENLKRLSDKDSKVDVGFVQGGVAKPEETAHLVSLGGVFYTPLWVFYRNSETLDDLSQLKGKRVSIGPEGSGVRRFGIELLRAAGISGPPTVLLELPNTESGKAILEDRVDAVMMFGLADIQIVQELVAAPGIKLMNLSQAEAYTRLFPVLSHVVLPKGIFNPATRSPAADINLIAPTTHLVIRDNMHPALIYLLLKAAAEIHGGAGWVHRAGEFPSIKAQDFPVIEEAQRYYKSGGSVLYDYLPFWAAALVNRLILVLIPLGVVLIPLIGILPWVYTYRNRSRFYRYYRELMNLDKDLPVKAAPGHLDAFHERLDGIEDAVGRIRVSVVFYDEVFILKEHIQMVREKLIYLRQASTAEPGEDG